MFLKGYKILCVEVYTAASSLYMHHLVSHFCMCKLLKFYWELCVHTVLSAAPHSLIYKLCAGMHGKSSLFAFAEESVIMFDYNPFSTVLGFLKLQVARDWVRAICLLNIHSTVFGFLLQVGRN